MARVVYCGMRLTFLGTGTSMGVPMIGCSCDVCRSPDPHNRRLRTSAFVEVAGVRLLIDAGPDLRQQALAAGIGHVDAVLLSHAHADHVAGIDDLRPLNFARRGHIPLYGSRHTLAAVRERFAYAFDPASSQGSTRPALTLVELDTEPFSIGGAEIVPVEVEHGGWTIHGFRIGALGYVTDASAVSEATIARLCGVDTLVLNALRHAPHPNHLSIAQAQALVARIAPRQAWLVHLGHEVDHQQTNAMLPPHIRLAHDGLMIEVGE